MRHENRFGDYFEGRHKFSSEMLHYSRKKSWKKIICRSGNRAKIKLKMNSKSIIKTSHSVNVCLKKCHQKNLKCSKKAYIVMA